MEFPLGAVLAACGGWGRRDWQEGRGPGLTWAGLLLQEQFMFWDLGSGHEQCWQAAGRQGVVSGSRSGFSKDFIIMWTVAVVGVGMPDGYGSRWAPQTSVRVKKFQGTVSAKVLSVPMRKLRQGLHWYRSLGLSGDRTRALGGRGCSLREDVRCVPGVSLLFVASKTLPIIRCTAYKVPEEQWTRPARWWHTLV